MGLSGGTHIGGSFARAAARLEIPSRFFDAADAWAAPRIIRALSWRLRQGRPPRLRNFSSRVAESCVRERPTVLISVGTGWLDCAALQNLRSSGIECWAYSTDDPWNPAVRAKWQLPGIALFNRVFTTRVANMDDFRALGCADVRHLPFGYDDELFRTPADPLQSESYDVLFVGGADRDRAAFMREFLRSGLKTALVGGYWDRYPEMRAHALGSKSPHDLAGLTQSAKVNLCLVRRANRDGHVMRSFEIAACGGCILAEDTNEHREIFGDDGETVLFFRGPRDAAQRALSLLSSPGERARLAAAVKARVGVPHLNSYSARLKTMLETEPSFGHGASMVLAAAQAAQ